MKPLTQQIVNTVEELIKDTYYSLVGDEPFFINTWLQEEKPKFSLKNLLLDQNALTLVSKEDFLSQINKNQSQTVKDQYQNLITILETNLLNLTFYNYDFPKLPSELFNGSLPIENEERSNDKIPLIIASTDSGEWIGLMPEQQCQTESSPKFIIPALDSVKEENKALIEQIKSVTNQINHQSQCWSLENSWQIVITNSCDSLIEKLLYEAHFLDVYEIDKFLRLDKQSPDEMDEESNYFELSNLFNSQLINSRVYNLVYIVSGEFFTIHYALGETKEGDWLGVITDSFTF